MLHSLHDLAVCISWLRLPNTTDLNLLLSHGGVINALLDVVVVAANVSAVSLPGIPA